MRVNCATSINQFFNMSKQLNETNIPLSIITVNLNNRDGLKKTIDSIVAQTYQDFEWIVIDGGSTDGSKELIEENQSHITYWISEPDKGIYNAMNKGLSHVHGEYVNFMNSGDVLYNRTTLEELFNNQLTGDLIYGDWIEQENKKYTHYYSPKEATLDFFYSANICHQATFIKSTIMKKYSFNEKYKIVADWEIWIKMLLDGYSMQYVQQTICIFDANDGLSSIKDTKLMDERNIMRDNTIPPFFLSVLQDNYRMKNIVKYIDNSQLSINDLIFFRWHTKLTKIVKFCIKILSYFVNMRNHGQ